MRRDSVEARRFQALLFAMLAAQECHLMLRAVRDSLNGCRGSARRTEGRRSADAEAAVAGLTARVLRAFEKACALARLNRGRVLPSHDCIAAMTELGRAIVTRSTLSRCRES